MNLSVGVVAAFLICLISIMGSADSATLQKNPSFRNQAKVIAKKPSFVKPLERQLTSNVPTDPSETLNQVNEGVSQAPPVPLGVRIIQHVKELLQALNINIHNIANNLVLRIPVEIRQNIARGLGQIQTYLETIVARINEKKPHIIEQENSPALPAAETETSEITNEDEIDAPTETTTPNTAAVSDDEKEEEDEEEKVVVPQPKQLTKNQRRRLNRQQQRTQNSAQG
uniref:Uncharacterized protein n=1 Tax=Cacopsylla melanoneura TaxID=428564 RepID=A0A8D9EGN0_9HEMI